MYATMLLWYRHFTGQLLFHMLNLSSRGVQRHPRRRKRRHGNPRGGGKNKGCRL